MNWIPSGRRTLFAACFLLWILGVGYGAKALLLYANTPGAPAVAPESWPAAGLFHLSPVQLSLDKATLLLFIHPQCSCSSSTLGEFAKIVASSRDRVETTIFFYQPPGAPEDWSHTTLWHEAEIIPGVKLLLDPDAYYARRFGARTSGQALLYDSLGHLAFSGGITRFRGHSGDNDGRDAITALLRSGSPLVASSIKRTPVFGCALYGE